MRRLLLLGKEAILAHRLARPLAAESDDQQHSRLAVLDFGETKGLTRRSNAAHP
jgi:hypothetical protein